MNQKALLQLGAELFHQFRHGNQAADRAFAGYVTRRKFLGAHDKRFLADIFYQAIRNLRRYDEAILSAFSGTVIARERPAAGFPVTSAAGAATWEWPPDGPGSLDATPPRQYPEDRAVDTARLGLGALERGDLTVEDLTAELERCWPTSEDFKPVKQASLLRMVERAREVATLYLRPKRLTEADRAQSWPAWLWAMFADGRTPEDAAATAQALSGQAPATLRVNTLATDRARAAEALRAADIPCREHPWLPDALTLEGRVSRARLPRATDGWFEWQDAGSQAIGLFTGVRPGMTVLDACAGAGGKTLHLAAMMKNQGEIHAFDADTSRLEVLHRRALRNAVTCLRPPGAALPDRFDLILLDVPCSGTGAFRRNPEGRWRLSAARMEVLRRTQQELIEKWAGRLAPGGMLVYATCSLLRAENQHQVEGFLDAHPSCAMAPPPELPEGFPLTAAGELESDPARHGCDGFYAARLRRK